MSSFPEVDENIPCAILRRRGSNTLRGRGVMDTSSRYHCTLLHDMVVEQCYRSTSMTLSCRTRDMCVHLRLDGVAWHDVSRHSNTPPRAGHGNGYISYVVPAHGTCTLYLYVVSVRRTRGRGTSMSFKWYLYVVITYMWYLYVVFVHGTCGWYLYLALVLGTVGVWVWGRDTHEHPQRNRTRVQVRVAASRHMPFTSVDTAALG